MTYGRHSNWRRTGCAVMVMSNGRMVAGIGEVMRLMCSACWQSSFRRQPSQRSYHDDDVAECIAPVDIHDSIIVWINLHWHTWLGSLMVKVLLASLGRDHQHVTHMAHGLAILTAQ